MNFIGFGQSKVLGLVDQCLQEAMAGTLLWFLLGLSIGILLYILMAKLQFFDWKKPLSRYILRIIFLLFPIVLGGLSAGIYALNSSMIFMEKEVEKSILPMTKIAFPTFQFFLNSNWEKKQYWKYSYDQMIQIYLSGMNVEVEGDNPKDLLITKIAHDYSPKITQWGLQAIIDEIIAQQWINGNRVRDKKEEFIYIKEIDIAQFNNDFWNKIKTQIEDNLKKEFKKNITLIRQYMIASIGLIIMLTFLLYINNKRKEIL